MNLSRGLGKTAEHLVAPLFTGFAVAVALLWLGPKVAEYQALRNPTCEDPQGAIPIPAKEISAKLAPGPDPEPPYVEVVAASPTEDEPEGVSDGAWADKHAADGNTRTIWVPSDADVNAGTAQATFSFGEKVHVALVCVVNGNPTDGTSYFNANRVRMAELTTDNGDHHTVYLESFGEADMQDQQTIVSNAGKTSRVTLTVKDTYPGRNVYDAQREVFLTPTGHTAIAEVVFFRRDPDVRPWWSPIWPFD
jgi:hypothetical protein